MKMNEGLMGITKRKWKINRYRLCLEKLKQEECRAEYSAKLDHYLRKERSESIEEEWLSVKKAIMKAADESLGKKKCGGKGKRWWNKAIEELVHSKKVAYQKWLSSRTAEHKREYRVLCKKVKESIEEGKRNVWEEFVKYLKVHFFKDPKMFWKKVNRRKGQDRVMVRDNEGKCATGGKGSSRAL